MSTQRPSLSTAFAGLLATLLGMLPYQARACLVLNWAKKIGRLLMMLAAAAALLVFACLALLVASLLVVFVYSTAMRRLIAMGLLVLGYALIAAGLGWYLRQTIVNRPPMFAAHWPNWRVTGLLLLKRTMVADEESAA